MGAEAYNVDSHEWTTLAAHAQPDAGQTLCEAANATATRASTLGSEISAALEMPPSEARANTLAVALGRVLHTLQDNCAHQGVANPQHGWYSLMDSCEGTKLSPDVQAGAEQCANAETEAVMYEFADLLYDAGVGNEELDDTDDVSTHWPKRGEVCEFLSGAEEWNGQDVRWNSPLVVAELRDHLIQAMWATPKSFDFCALPDSQLAASSPDQPVDTSAGPDWCLKLNLFCVGKADVPDEAPPWVAAPEPQPTASGSSESGGGCSVSSARGGPADASWIAMLAGLALVTRMRRRSRSE